jgi:ankyrin repeat protein
MDLVTAAQTGNLDDLEAGLQQGLEVNLANADNVTPLMAAAEAGHAAVVSWLLGHGAEMNQRMRKDGRP